MWWRRSGNGIKHFSFAAFFSSVKGCEAERCLWQIQRGAARAKQGKTKQSAGFDYVLPMGKSGAKKRSTKIIMGSTA
jgi:hypothetical protein